MYYISELEDHTDKMSTTQNNVKQELPMCGVCRNEPPVNPIKLKCSHIFCYLCIKSAYETSGLCPLCRDDMGRDFNFQRHAVVGTIQLPAPSPDGMYWFYEGARGWWLYDPETNSQLEQTFQRGERIFEKFIAGGVYVIDLTRMLQKRKVDEQGRTGRARRVCRASLELENIIGMAGLKGHDIKETLDMMRTAEAHNMTMPPPVPTQCQAATSPSSSARDNDHDNDDDDAKHNS